MNHPKNLMYTSEHEWVKIENNIATVGITDFAQGELGDIIFLEFPEVDEEFNEGDVFGTIEAVKTVSDLFMPISGKVESLNEELEANPQLINQDPYEKGWIIKITDFDKSSLEELLSPEEYREQLGL